MDPNESKFLSCISPVNLFYKTIERFAQNIKIEMILVKLPIAYCKSEMHTTLNHLKGTMSKYDNALLVFFKCGPAKMVSILNITYFQSSALKVGFFSKYVCSLNVWCSTTAIG